MVFQSLQNRALHIFSLSWNIFDIKLNAFVSYFLVFLLDTIFFFFYQKSKTVEHHRIGNYARMIMILLFIALLPFGLCDLAFIFFCMLKGCSWTGSTLIPLHTIRLETDAPQKNSSVKLKVRKKEEKRVILWRQKIFLVILDDFFLSLIMVSFNA